MSLASAIASSVSRDAEQRRDRPEHLLASTAAPSAGRRRARSGSRSSRAGRARWPPSSRRAPGRDRARHLVVRGRRRSTAWPAGPISVLGRPSGRRPRSAAIAVDERRRELLVDRVVDDEALGGDAGLAVVDRARPSPRSSTARSRSALAMTMNGSLPPSSSTVFLRCLPATAATALPAAFAAGERDGARRARRRGCARDPLRLDQQRLEDTLGRAGAPEQLARAPARTAGRWTRA